MTDRHTAIAAELDAAFPRDVEARFAQAVEESLAESVAAQYVLVPCLDEPGVYTAVFLDGSYPTGWAPKAA